MTAATLLLVEDSAPFRRSAAETLRSHGYRVLEAVDGGSALGLVSRESPSLVLLDSTLPDFEAADLVGSVVVRRPYEGGLVMPPALLVGARERGPGTDHGDAPALRRLAVLDHVGGADPVGRDAVLACSSRRREA